MYISNIKIENYRNFESISVDFSDGINLLIGANNSGKSNILKALSLIFSTYSKKQLSTSDIYNNIPLPKLKAHSPKISITIEFSQSQNEDLMSDDLVTVSNWLVSLEEPYRAQVKYEFFLPQSEEEKYISKVVSVSSKEEIYKIINNDFIRFYINKIWIGNPTNQIQIDSDSLNKFDFQFLDAIRDVERDMFSGKNTLLKSVIDFFMDYDIKSNNSLTEIVQQQQILLKNNEFKSISSQIIKHLQKRLSKGKDEILSYAKSIGALFDDSKPDFQGNLTETELYSVLQLIIKQNSGMSIPISNNGLGYNNLIFMSLLLSKMQVDSNGKYLGNNAKVFPILAIEEPEAHLHPTMQFQFIKFLQNNIKNKKVKQIFITSHSTHITSSAKLDSLICLYKNNNQTNIAYPGTILNNTPNSKKYVQRFLDATKSNMLFAEKIIFVEGIAEQLLIPIFAKYLDKPLEDYHVSLINIGGRYFNHFLNIFDSVKENTINKKIACITDLDPTRKDKSKEKEKYKKCYPFEVDLEPEKYIYKKNETPLEYKEHPNIKFFTQEKIYGKTLEYQIAFENETNKLLITDSLKNNQEITNLIDLIKGNKNIDEILEILSSTVENKRIKTSIKNSNFDIKYKKKAIIASRYLNSVEKGENALELSSNLNDNLEKKGTSKYKNFNIPQYIKEAINWICDN